MRWLLVLASMLPALAAGAECSVRSGPTTNALVELYTSEGCSSCPPADRWLSGLSGAAATGQLVPLAFHVNYWDYIGWKDPFASARGTERQRAIQKAAGARYVYTPQVVLGGRDFREWRSPGSYARALEAIVRRPARVTLELAARVSADRGIDVSVSATGVAGLKDADLVLLVAATQNGLGSRVTAGENRGERLAHDFVVRDFSARRGLGSATERFTPGGDWNLERLAIAAFVQDARSGEVLQAVSLPLCR